MQKKYGLAALLLTLLAALAYLPLVSQIGYLNDDWYLMFDGSVGGASFFHQVYSIDRPLRGYLMQAAFSLFGMNPLPYHLSAFVFRALSGLILLWVLERLWQKNFFANLAAAALFLLYPGFLSQVNPIDYQSQLFSLACGLFSVALTLEALRIESKPARVALTLASILTGWVYLGLVEYFLGFEALRLLAIFLPRWRDSSAPALARVKAALLAWLPFSAAPLGFLLWRVFLFDAARKATDVGLQLSQGFSSSLNLSWQFNYLIQDTFNVLVTAWAYPLYALVFPLRLREMLTGLGLAAFSAALIFLGLRFLFRHEEDARPTPRSETLWLGWLTLIAGLIPVILVNRHIIFPDYSRYALAPAVGAAILTAALLANFSSRSLRLALMAALVAAATLTHYGNAARAASETEATRAFWQQVSWRVIQIEPGTTLIASYAGSGLSEDYFVWGPANLIYYPQAQESNPLNVPLPAAVLTNDAALQILSNGGVESPLRRGNQLTRDFGNVLVITQATPQSCARVINGNAPELSPQDSPRIFLIAPSSRLDAVKTEGKFPVPPAVVFGNQPPQGWCYFYEQADFARQIGAWELIPILLQQARDGGHYPNDKLEWMPFLQGAAKAGDVESMRTMMKLLSADKFLRAQTCALMSDFMQREMVTDEVRFAVEHGVCQ